MKLKYIISAVYLIVVLLMLFSVWQNKNILLQGRDSPLYRNLRDSPAYVKHGFSPDELDIDETYIRFPAQSRAIIDSTLDLPARRFFSPWGREAQEFTIIILVDIDSETYSLLTENQHPVPGMYFAGIGQNWEIYFNEKLIMSQMHLDKNGRITSDRTWRDVYFPLDRSLFVSGTNILAFRIVGDPTYMGTGLFYTSAPIYMDDYSFIEIRNRYSFIIFFSGILCFVGLYYILLFFTIRRKEEIYNLFFGIFSFMFGVYSVTRCGWINIFIPNTDIAVRFEYLSISMALLTFGMFVETIGRGKISKITYGYMIFCIFIIITQNIFMNQYTEDSAFLWNIVTLIYYCYTFAYNIIYFYFRNQYMRKKQRIAQESYIGNVLIGLVLMFVCGILDLIDMLTIVTGIHLFQYSIFAAHLGMTITLVDRYTVMYKRLETQIEVLLAQIKPHFLYNTMAVIKSLCETDPQAAKETIIELTDYLRSNLDSLSEKRLIPFEKELRHTEAYLKIEKKRFDDMLNIVYDIQIKNFFLPALTLQPLVENAVKHGILAKEDGGTVTIRTEEKDNEYIISVIDDGAGFSNDSGELEENIIRRSHVGIENVKKRLFTMCKGKLQIINTSDFGTTVIISIQKKYV